MNDKVTAKKGSAAQEDRFEWLAQKMEDRFEWFARVMKEEFDDVRGELRAIETKLRKEITDSEGKLRLEIREAEERLQYRIGKTSLDWSQHLETAVEPKIENHERRITKLEAVRV